MFTLNRYSTYLYTYILYAYTFGLSTQLDRLAWLHEVKQETMALNINCCSFNFYRFITLFLSGSLVQSKYSLLQTVVEACQKKKHCKFNARPQFYGLGTSGVGESSGSSSTYHSTTVSTNIISMDPCPKRRKIVEIAYKCRPCKYISAHTYMYLYVIVHICFS